MSQLIGVDQLIKLEVLDRFIRIFQQEVRKKRGRAPDFVVIVIDRRSQVGAALFTGQTTLQRQTEAGGDRFAFGLVTNYEALCLIDCLGGIPNMSDWRKFRKARFDIARVLCVGTPTLESGDLPCLSGGVTAPEGGWNAPFSTTDFDVDQQRQLIREFFQEHE